jgi:hypothetical protein
MSSFIMKIYTTRHIGTAENIRRFLSVLEKYDMLPDKIGEYEPLKQAYSLDEAIKMWKNAPAYVPDRRGGDLIGKKKEPNIRFDAMWNIGESAIVNHETLWFTRRSFKQRRDVIDNLFKDLIVSIESMYGYISDFIVDAKQHVTGTIAERMNGIFWCNYYGKVYVDFFGIDRILSAPWFKTEILDNGGIITYLTGEPDDKQLTESTELADKFKEYLGKDSFGDVEAWRKANILPPNDDTQYKNVPKLDLSEIRRLVSDFAQFKT